MGSFFSSLFDQLSGILMLGLDGAGKTTILFKLKLGEVVHTIPTIGFNVESIQYRSVTLQVWDVGGQDKIRRLWKFYYQGTKALIFVVDSNDTDRVSLAAEQLHAILNDEEMRNVVLLVFANKSDLPHALSTSELTDRLGLYQLRANKWYVQGACATTGDGLYEGLDWVTRNLKR